jgi:hypothetical protein
MEPLRRLIIACACVLAAMAPQVAAAQPRLDVRSNPPADLRAGETWNLDLFVHATAKEIASSGPPTVLIHNDAAGWRTIRVTRVPGEHGAYTAAVAFPSQGTWTYHVHDPIAGGGYEFEPIVVAAPSDSGSPLALWLVAGSTLGLAPVAAAILVARLRRRSQAA